MVRTDWGSQSNVRNEDQLHIALCSAHSVYYVISCVIAAVGEKQAGKGGSLAGVSRSPAPHKAVSSSWSLRVLGVKPQRRKRKSCGEVRTSRNAAQLQTVMLQLPSISLNDGGLDSETGSGLSALLYCPGRGCQS